MEGRISGFTSGYARLADAWWPSDLAACLSLG
jgi:hypothetical protein